MEPLDLRAAPPRSPRIKLGGLWMLARTIDKLRATLPGGYTGAYKIPGFSQRLLEALGVSEDEMRNAVANARGDDDVVEWLRAHSDPSAYEEINRKTDANTVGDWLDRPDFLERYPNAKNVPPETRILDLLDIDDAQTFANVP